MCELTDIEAPRLLLRLFSRDAIAAGLAGDVEGVNRLLRAKAPPALFEDSAVLNHAQARLQEDPEYLPWSARALLLKGEKEPTMVGHIRFHSRPDPDYLRPFAENAVEFGYVVFAPYRRCGYAEEAVRAAMQWASDRHGVARFVVTIAPDNLASVSLIAKLAFRRVGEHMDPVDGLEHVYLREVNVIREAL